MGGERRGRVERLPACGTFERVRILRPSLSIRSLCAGDDIGFLLLFRRNGDYGSGHVAGEDCGARFARARRRAMAEAAALDSVRSAFEVEDVIVVEIANLAAFVLLLAV